jgi:TonB-dependent receptor
MTRKLWPSRPLMTHVSFAVLCAVLPLIPAAAQQGSDDQLQEVVVRGQRAALQAAQDRKEMADQILDSITADDAGKLPDNSVTEVLQRVPGVTISHFGTPGPGLDSNHYQTEGTGLMVRGLPNVASWLNGRETFSANGARALSFEDVPPELLSAVDVYKSPNASQIQGGLGGSVDLRTKLPFDYKELTLAATAEVNYGDLAKEAKGGGSVLLADRWNTPIGEFGAVVDIAESTLTDAHDDIEIKNYLPQAYNGKTVFVPDAGGWNHSPQTRDRLGAYEALQWKPSDDLMVYQTGFRSDYWSRSLDHLVQFAGGGAYNNHLAPGSVNTFDGAGYLTSSTALTANASIPIAPNGFTLETIPENFSSHNVTTDLAVGTKWQATSRLLVESALQYTVSSDQFFRQALFADTTMPTFGLDLTGSTPSFAFPSASYLSNPQNWTWTATMDHIEAHVGRALAWNADGTFDVSENGLLRDIKFGARLSARKEKDDVSTYNWQALAPTWSGSTVPLANATPGDYTTFKISNFFHGGIAAPPTLLIPSDALVLGYPGNVTTIHQKYQSPALSWPNPNPVAYTPNNLGNQFTDTQSAYLMLDFADDTHLPAPINGNIGVRLENVQNKSVGMLSWGQGVTVVNPATGVGSPLLAQFIPDTGGTHYTKEVPSLNFQVLPTDDIHWRFAASQEVANPDFNALSTANSGVSLNTDNNHLITGASGQIGNPNIKPETANQLDTSLEYYFPGGGQAHVAGFYKKIHDYITYQITTTTFPFVFANGGSFNMPAAITQETNSSAATLDGIELGVQKFFTFLPEPFDGLGVDANWTYIDSKAPGTVAYDIMGNPIHNLPAFGISKRNYNVTGMYSKGPVDVRLSYVWRSKYLLTTPNSTSTYTDPSGKTITYALPGFVGDAGYLDASVSYRFSDQVEFSLQGQNLAGTVSKYLEGYGDQQHVTHWVDVDKRVMARISVKY